VARVPGADVRKGAAESLPWPEDSFDVALAQLVLHFLDDPVAGLVEMRRVVRPGGMVAACTWNFSEMLLLRIFWEAARSVVPAAPAETLEVASLEEFGEPWQASRPRRGRRRAPGRLLAPPKLRRALGLVPARGRPCRRVLRVARPRDPGRRPRRVPPAHQRPRGQLHPGRSGVGIARPGPHVVDPARLHLARVDRCLLVGLGHIRQIGEEVRAVLELPALEALVQ